MPEPEAYEADAPFESARAGVPVTTTGSLNATRTWTTSPALNEPSGFKAEMPVTVGAVVSIVMFVLASRLPPAPGATSVRLALFAAVSAIVPPLNASAVVPVYASGAAFSPGCTT